MLNLLTLFIIFEYIYSNLNYNQLIQNQDPYSIKFYVLQTSDQVINDIKSNNNSQKIRIPSSICFLTNAIY